MNHCEIGDCREIMRRWIAEGVRVQMCVTSPPYWGLRDYQNEPLIWGGSDDCVHEFSIERLIVPCGTGGNWQQAENGPGLASGRPQTRFRGDVKAAAEAKTTTIERGFCHCGAWRGSLGLEPTPELFVEHIVEVFRLVRELLADDGTLWLNLGSSYNAAGREGHGTREGCKQGTNRASAAGADRFRPGSGRADGIVDARAQRNRDGCNAPGFKPKDMVPIPWMVAMALQVDGWYLRQDIIWAKPNPMPESVRDRCTKSHEYLFLLSKQERYYYDADAIAEPFAEASIARLEQPSIEQQSGSYRVPGKTNGPMKACGPSSYRGSSFTTGKTAATKLNLGQGERTEAAGRNKRSVWTIATQPYRDAHFATFPPALIEPCILAGSTLFACAACGCAAPVIEFGDESSTTTMPPMPRMVQTEAARGTSLQQDLCEQMVSEEQNNDEGICYQSEGLQAYSCTNSSDGDTRGLRHGTPDDNVSQARTQTQENRNSASLERYQGRQPAGKSRTSFKEKTRQITETGHQTDTMSALRRHDKSIWSCPSCGCDRVRHSIILDPFLGSGTTGQVAQDLGRRWLGCELNSAYLELQQSRTRQLGMELA